jgi:hypothetical protein
VQPATFPRLPGTEGSFLLMGDYSRLLFFCQHFFDFFAVAGG